MLQQDVQKSLELLTDLLTKGLFTQASLDKIKAQITTQLKKFWDTPNSFCNQLARKAVYQNHSQAMMMFGSQ